MTWREALRTRLVNGNTAAAARVTWIGRAAGATLPAIVLTHVGGIRTGTLKGQDRLRGPRVQIDAWAATSAAAEALLGAALALLDAPFAVGGIRFNAVLPDGEPRDLPDDVSGTLIFRQSVDVIAWHITED